MMEPDELGITVHVNGQQVPSAPGELPGTPEDWWVRCIDPDGNLVYDGPAPVPAELCTITLDDVGAGRFFEFVVIPMRALN